MDYRKLGRTDLEVSALCLGTMTFPTHTPEEDAHRQLDMALDHGLNFIDTAEMYPVNPVKTETMGETESCIGRWLAKSGRREDVVIATKVNGPGGFTPAGYSINPETMRAAVERSLSRLGVECIDLYQLHWPNRGSYHFRKNWNFAPEGQDREGTRAHMEELLEAMTELRAAGKIRHFGLSNDTAWGTTMWNHLAEAKGAPRMETVQNEYSLLCRLYDTDMAEMSHHEEVSLLSYSPLAAGLLTGKYQGGARPEGSRAAINGDLGGRINPRSEAATEEYLALAKAHGLDPVHMALAWAMSRPFMGSVIFGATTSAQLAHILEGRDLVLSEEVMKAIGEIYRRYPMPY